MKLDVVINGEPRSFEGPLLVSELLERLGLPRSGVAVERNRSIVPRATHESTEVEDGDVFEVVTLVGGG